VGVSCTGTWVELGRPSSGCQLLAGAKGALVRCSCCTEPHTLFVPPTRRLLGGSSSCWCGWGVRAPHSVCGLCVRVCGRAPHPPPNTRVGLWPSAVCVRMLAPLTAQACPRSEMHAIHVIQKVRRGGVPTSTCTEGATAALPALGWRASTPKWAVSNCFGRRKTGGDRAPNFVWDPPPSSCSNTAKLLN